MTNTEYLRVAPDALDKARQLARYLPDQIDALGRRRVPGAADAAREALRLGLDVLDAKLRGGEGNR